MDPSPHFLSLPADTAPELLLKDFRARLRRTAWGHETPDTLLVPAWSEASSLERFESALRALFRAHLKALDAARTGRCPGEYEHLGRIVDDHYLDWPALPAEAPPSRDVSRHLFGRPDVILAPDGPKVVETNFDTAAAGHERPDDMWTIAADLFRVPDDLLRTGRPMEGLRRHFLDLSEGEPCDIHWIMKDDEATRRELAPSIDFLNRGHRQVRHTVHYAGDPPPAPPAGRAAYLHRSCSIFTVNRDRERFAALLSRLAPATRGCTVPVSLSPLSSKLFLAWLSDPGARPATLTDEEGAAVDALVPWTRVLTLLDPEELLLVRRDRGDFVLKKADSHQAKDVHFGCNLSAGEWCALLEAGRSGPAARASGPDIWIVQERVRPREYTLTEITDAGVVERRTGLSCCPYLMGGRLRGLETWVMPFTPDMGMIERMHFLAHFVRTP
ncbi:hypothetical protein FHS43_004895 [Streptosporangium becharense]|uniref:Glutathionylspermidine synthase pre-ATP-grasp-like domain-containing protein n=1 Tax=Streptosporangium becharense TaxID=1816182 RepID=A0A7W9IBG9_9ACTN|nr:hypothetical protein [Streptosporangium becharense]MBB2913586.1 hypothetical protein [Streptosporangium becharense]MBB5817667.1 hypothetical protein [Streptosporangium becharense]